MASKIAVTPVSGLAPGSASPIHLVVFENSRSVVLAIHGSQTPDEHMKL
jgi:hypothetical protein